MFQADFELSNNQDETELRYLLYFFRLILNLTVTLEILKRRPASAHFPKLTLVQSDKVTE